MKLKQVEKVHTIAYLTHFITRAFLIAVLCTMVLVFLVVSIYFGDLLLNTNNSKKAPLFSTYLIVSPSMVPTIMIDDAIVVKRVDNDKYKVGDIISFASTNSNYEGLTITHRIVNKETINKNNSMYTTKGDNNSTVDSTLVNTSSIYGKVMLKIPNVGSIKKFFSKPINYIICLVVVTLIYVFYELGRVFFKDREKEVEE